MKKIMVNFDLCTGCELCALICSFKTFGGFNPHRAMLQLNLFYDGVYNMPEVCRQCQRPACMKVCPVGALKIEQENGYVFVDRETCIGCGQCEKACPIGMIWLDKESKKSYKCDLCEGHPLCVERCPTNALVVVDYEV